MTPAAFARERKFVETSFGRIAYVARGTGPAAIFLHGVPLNGYHWRGQLERLGDLRTCIALDLLGLGATEPRDGADLSFVSQSQMVLEVLDRLRLSEVDLVANDSGGAIAQLIAVAAPERVRSLVLTNCDVHDNWPPPAFEQAFALAQRGLFASVMMQALRNLPLAQSDLGLGAGFENPATITADLVETYLGPIGATPARMAMLDSYVRAMDCRQTTTIEAQLATVTAPTLVIWGLADIFFPVRWAHWLADRLGGSTRVVEVPGSRLFMCEERPEYISGLIREHWAPASPEVPQSEDQT